MSKDNQHPKAEKLSANQLTSLRWFYDGNYIDLCVDICNQFGELIPSNTSGATIVRGTLSALMVRGFITTETVYIFRIQYTRFVITPLGRQLIDGANHV